MPVFYGDRELRPVQGVEIADSPQSLGDGRRAGKSIRATVSGTITPGKILGVEAPVDHDSLMATILRQQEEIQATFAEDGRLFQVFGWDASLPREFAARVVEGPTFRPDRLLHTCEWSVVLEGADYSVQAGTNEHILSAEESWEFDDDDRPGLKRASHRCSARGQLAYDGTGGIPVPAWERARSFVRSRLGLGFAAAVAGWSPKSGAELASESEAAPPVQARDYAVQESVDEAGGGYSASETWILSADPAYEEYAAKVDRRPGESGGTVAVEVSGTIVGFFDGRNAYADRIVNARARWATVKGQLASRAAAAAPGTTLPAFPYAIEIDEEPTRGRVSYRASFDDRPAEDGTLETYQVSRRAQAEDYRATVRVSGEIRGILDPTSESDGSLRLQRAKARFAAIEPLLIERARGIGVTGLVPAPLSAESSEDPNEGSVSYSYEFDNRTPGNVRDEYVVEQSYSQEDGLTTVSVSGRITGIRDDALPFTPEGREERFQQALAHLGAIEPQMLGRARDALPNDLAPLLGPALKRRTRADDRHNGVVSYAFEYDTKGSPCTPGAISEVLRVSTVRAVPLIAEFNVPGRAIGPIVQDIGTKSRWERTVVLEAVMPRRDACGDLDAPEVDLSPYAPAGQDVRVTSDQEEWTPRTGRLVRTMSWRYNK